MNTIKSNFFRDADRENSEGLAPIKVRSRHNSDKLIIRATGLFSPRKDKDKYRVHVDTVTQNKLDALKLSIGEAYKELSASGQKITLADVWNHLYPSEGTTSRPKSDYVADWIDFYISLSPYSPSYLKGARMLKAHLTGKSDKGKQLAFNPKLRFSEINQSTVNALSAHIVKQGLSTGSVVKVVKFLKQVAKCAADHRVQVSTNFKAPTNFKKKVKTEVRLTIQEVAKIAAIPLKGNDEAVRDMFVWLCNTGMRVSDMMHITPAEDHGDFLLYKQQKTGEDVAVTLNKTAKALLRKYGKDKEATDRIFPQFTQQFINRTVKDIAKAAGLKELVKVTSYSGTKETVNDLPKYQLIKSHTGRRSFSRMLSLAEVPDNIIGEEMGHGGQTITQHYIGNSDHLKRIRLVQKAWQKAADQAVPKPLMRALA